jgi:hypothetical protein
MLGLRIYSGVSVERRALRAQSESGVQACPLSFAFSVSRPASPVQ